MSAAALHASSMPRTEPRFAKRLPKGPRHRCEKSDAYWLRQAAARACALALMWSFSGAAIPLHANGQPAPVASSAVADFGGAQS